MTGAKLLQNWRDVDLAGGALMFSLSMGLRLAALLVAGLVFFNVTRPTDFYDAFIAVRLPHAIAFAFSLSMALLPAYVEKASEILESQTARGLDLRAGGLWQRSRKFITVAVPLFMQMLRHSQLLAIALESRGFSPLHKRTSYRVFKLMARDYLIAAVFIAVVGGLLFLRFKGIGVLPNMPE
jgi:energy-coupling factor transport system permease protein